MLAIDGSTVTATLAEYAAGTDFESLPAHIRERAKLVILDELASGYFGAACPAGRLAARYVAGQSAAGEALVLRTGHRTSAEFAALANGTAGHADEIDGAHVVGGHPGATLVHAAAAMAQSRRSSGADLINAVVLGYDVGTRLIDACGGTFRLKDTFHLHADFLHAVGAAAACARLLGLDARGIANAMALATFRANGLCALFRENDHISKAFCNGQYASAGVGAALMAKAGLEGVADVIGERHGLLDAWGTDDGRERAVQGLGTAFGISGGNFKFLRAGYPIHAATEAALAIMHEHDRDHEAVRSVLVGMPANARRVVDGRAMHNICLQDMLAVALLHDGIRLSESYFPGVESDPAFARIRERITLRTDPDLQREQPNGRGAVVTIAFADGTTATRRVDHPRGHSLRGEPTWADLAGKWRDALPGTGTDAWVSSAASLEAAGDVAPFLELFGADAPLS
ncbi:MmgE/PrpD family protein [Amycolatopsis rubida]|uniref:MmgE/PrpD family protein n=1 Tax=Amycolatopsis rubida TaxID=112413 RepID=A0ABX0C207_9PSEU|nr:MmgE/PrpD family protein [Amycolatopsis rubida]MYW96202.1 MmgE/PrpD family protein [Amycolatopsis rubida]NEC61193.1 MmgE/PrpD family protein [Amycolatopsis rubida]